MVLRKLFDSVFSAKAEQFSKDVTPQSMDFYLESAELFDKVKRGETGINLQSQYLLLNMLAEQEEATLLPNGFEVKHSVIARLEDYDAEALALPKRWKGVIQADVSGNSRHSNFTVALSVTNDVGQLTNAYSVKGAILSFGELTQFRLSAAEYSAFFALQRHLNSDKTEFDNLSLVHALQESATFSQHVKYDLQHFQSLSLLAPERVIVTAEETREGDLLLTPNVGQHASNDKMQTVLGQIMRDDAASLRVGDEIVLLNEKTLTAMQEVIVNRKVPKERVKDFLANPTRYIDASLVDLDLGFSVRVNGATEFQHAYFGETDESGINWFGNAGKQLDVKAIAKLGLKLVDGGTCDLAMQFLDDALATAADVMEFDGDCYDISSASDAYDVIEAARESLLDGEPPDALQGGEEIESDNTAEIKVVVDVALNDESVDYSADIEKSLADISYQGDLPTRNFLRQPFPHQDAGIRWCLGLLAQNVEGGILADDMGLGKTYMALASLYYFKTLLLREAVMKPALVIAPLSLLENWSDEVGKTFKQSPFKDVIILQSNADLNRFREAGVETRQQITTDAEASPQYSLKIGSSFAEQRLDMPERLVITTYQTLRDYQFSLCSIDWSVVIFDEAQNIKNPNALQTRAAKGLRAQFKLIATGTPVENSLADFWCLMDTALAGFLGSYQDFRAEYISPILQASADDVDQTRATVGQGLRKKVGPYMLRRTKEDELVGLPSKRVFVGVQHSTEQYEKLLDTTMQANQLDCYNSLLKQFSEAEKPHVLTTIQQLRDCSLHPQLLNGGMLKVADKAKEIKQLCEESNKFKCLLDVLKQIQHRREKVIIFCVNKRLQSFLSLALSTLFKLPSISIINGDAKAVAKRKSVPTRKTMIEAFEQVEGFNIIVMSPVAAGVGLTVIGANNVIHFERHWNPAKEAQATDRVYRIGQQKDVNVYLPIIHHPEFDSFDVNLHQLLSQKSLLKDAVITSQEVVPNPLSNDVVFDKQVPMKITDIHRLSWKEFEAFAVALLKSAFQPKSALLTKDGADFGADGVLLDEDKMTLIQVKQKQGRYEGHQAIQQLLAAKPLYQSALTKAPVSLVFITNASQIGGKAKKMATEHDIQIITITDIEELLLDCSITYLDVLNTLSAKRLVI